MAAILGAISGLNGLVGIYLQCHLAANFTGRKVILSDNPNMFYTSNTATLALNFDTVSGEFRADGFTPDTVGQSPKTIEIDTNLTMDATDGTFQA